MQCSDLEERVLSFKTRGCLHCLVKCSLCTSPTKSVGPALNDELVANVSSAALQQRHTVLLLKHVHVMYLYCFASSTALRKNVRSWVMPNRRQASLPNASASSILHQIRQGAHRCEARVKLFKATFRALGDVCARGSSIAFSPQRSNRSAMAIRICKSTWRQAWAGGLGKCRSGRADGAEQVGKAPSSAQGDSRAPLVMHAWLTTQSDKGGLACCLLIMPW